MKQRKQRNVKWYGWRPDFPDARDLHYGAVLRSGDRLAIPESVDLTSKMPPVQNQGSIGSCTGHAAVAVLGYNLISQGKPVVPLSRLFAYYNARAADGNAASDTGATIRDMIKGLSSSGICTEDLWPYDPVHVTDKPPRQVYRKAIPNEIRVYARLNDLNDMLLCLAAGYPFMFGFTVYSNFESDAVAASGVVDLPAPGEYPVGGHAVAAVGYDQPAKRFLIRNSWGADWGQAGYFTLPFDYLTNRNLSDDFWTVRL